jgi:hypothetical protein
MNTIWKGEIIMLKQWESPKVEELDVTLTQIPEDPPADPQGGGIVNNQGNHYGWS